MAYFAYSRYYIKLEELSSGTGYADMVFLPKRSAAVPVLVIELKKDSTPEAAIRQIRERDYLHSVRAYGTEILLVGICYDGRTKKHRCRIEQVQNPGDLLMSKNDRSSTMKAMEL